MAMSSAALGADIQARLVAKGFDLSSSPFTEDFAMVIAEAVIHHIQISAQVLPGIPVATAGSPTAQTGATTGPGQVS